MRATILLCLLLCLACDTGPAATPTPIAPITWEGTGLGDTPRTLLPAGDYIIRWQTRPPATACPLVGFLIQAGDAAHARQFGDFAAGTTRINGLAAGAYYATIAAGTCAWTVAVEPAP